MKLFTGWVIAAGLVLTAAAANAQVLAPYEIGRLPYTAASDIGDPYVGGPSAGDPSAGMPPEAPVPRYGPALLPMPEVYAIVRESGFSPLGIPRLRGPVYMISVIDREGDDGRLLIDARTGRIVRFMPAYRMGGNFSEDLTAPYGAQGSLPPIGATRGVPRPPASVPRLASRTPSVPLPKASPAHAGEITRPLAAKPAAEPTQQSVAVQGNPAAPQTTQQTTAPAAVDAKPAPPIQPTQEMPKAQGLE